MKERPKVYLVGLDGFDPDIFSRLVREGVMPRLGEILERGVSGPLISTIPAYTGPAWVSIFTGVNPGRHGIFGFTRRREGEYRERVLNAGDIEADRLWEILNRSGIRTGVLNVPFTYPPAPLDGFMVSGMLTPSAGTPFVFPGEARSLLEEGGNKYIIDVPINLEKDWRDRGTLERLREELRAKEKALERLLDSYQPRFLMAVFTTPDRLQHLWYRLIRGEDSPPETAGFREEILSLYRRLDRAIGRLFDRLEEDDTFLVVSDHGFTAFEKTFYLNAWLAREGYLKLKTGGGVTALLAGVLNRPALKRRLPRFLIESARDRGLADLVDWRRTRAYSTPGMEEGLRINLAGREPAGTVGVGPEAEKLKSELKDKLTSLRDPETGRAVFSRVAGREEIYRGGAVDKAADLILEFSGPGWNISNSLVGDRLFRSWSKATHGLHRRKGFWGAAGPTVRRNPEPVEAGVEDIVPTVLSLFSLPSPPGLDGRTIPEAAGAQSGKSREAVREKRETARTGPAAFTRREEDEVKERLQGLGYL